MKKVLYVLVGIALFFLGIVFAPSTLTSLGQEIYLFSDIAVATALSRFFYLVDRDSEVY